MPTLTRMTLSKFLPASREELELYFGILVRNGSGGWLTIQHRKSRLDALLKEMINNKEIRKVGTHYDRLYPTQVV
jgi:hypothetical protein